MGASNKALANALKGLNTESKVAIVSQYGLTKAQKLGILASSGLTAEELKNVASTNAMATSQTVATGTTTGLTTAIKGLGTSLLNLAKAHPYLLAIAGTIAAIKLAKWGMDNFQNWADGTTAVNKYNKSIEKSEQTISDNESSISDYNSQLDENKQKLAELQELQTNGTITEAQKTEIENLKYENALLDDKIKKLQEANEEEKKSQANDSKKSFNKQFSDGYDVGSNANDVIKAVSKNYNGDGTANGISWNLATSGNENDTTVAQLAKIKLATDAYNQAVSDFNNGLNNVTQDDVDNYSTVLDLLTKDFEKNKETLYNQLKSDMEKMKAVEGTDDYDATAYANMQSWLEIFQQYIPEYKKAMEKVQEEADKNPIEQSVEVKAFDDPTSLLTESDDKGTSTATLADLQSEADLLSTIQKELSDNGKISVSSMQSIIKQYPEAKKALSEYLLGIISEEELFAELEGVYEDDQKAYIASLVEKSKYDGTYYDNLVSANNEFFQGLFDAYGEDLEKSKNLAQAKKVINDKVISLLASSWGKFYQTEIDNATGLMKIASKATSMDDDMDLGLAIAQSGGNEEEYFSDFLSTLQKTVDDYNALQNIAIDTTWGGIDTSWKELSGYDSSSSSSSKETAQDIDWIQRLVNKISTAYSRLKNIVSDTTSTWLNRNNALSDSMNTLSDEINAQKQAYEYYMNAFDSYDLDGYYKDQIANGSISIDVIYDDDLKEAISDCQDFYDKAQDAKTAVQELGIELKGLAKSKFDNISSEYEKEISYIKSYSDQLQKEMDIIETKGWFSSTSLNESLKKVEQENLDKLKQERDALVNSLNSAVSSNKIEKYSEAWYDMQSSIDDCTSSILDAEKALIEYDTAIRQVKWDAFDRTRDDVEDLINETDFLVELLKDVGITDDNGNITNEGKAAQALLVQKYQLYLNQAQKYKDEILKIDEELANNPYDKELLDRKQELIEKQQESIKSSIDEKNAIKDLVNDGYSDFIDKLQELVDARKKALEAEKDLYDYQKTISEQTKTIASLQKQLMALQGDNSESTQSKKQSLSNQLNEAQQSLSESEYEKYISDQEALMDTMMDQLQEWVNTRLDSLDELIQQIIDDSNTNSSDISDTITSTATSFGIDLSQNMADIWKGNTDTITSVFNNFSTKFDGTMTSLNNVVDGINGKVQEMLQLANEEAARRQAELEEQRRQQEVANNSSSDDSSYDYNYEPNYGDYSGGNDDSSSSDGVDWIYSPDYFPKDQLNVD